MSFSLTDKHKVILFAALYLLAALTCGGVIYFLTYRQEMKQRAVIMEKSASCVECHPPTTCRRGFAP